MTVFAGSSYCKTSGELCWKDPVLEQDSCHSWQSEKDLYGSCPNKCLKFTKSS